MKADAFDALTSRIARGLSRRRVLGMVGAGSVAGLVGVNTLPSPALAARPGCGVRSIVLWVNSFIPNNFGPVRTVPGGPFAGRTMINGPVAGLSDCFLTDNRSFDNRMNGGFVPESRITAWVNVDVENATIMGQTVFSHPTVEVDCEDGDVECANTSQPRGPGFHNISRFGNRITLELRTSGSNPCFTLAPGILVPDIDFEGRISLDVEPSGEVGVTFEGRVDAYPAYEIYVAPGEGGETKALLQRYPDPGSTARDLIFSVAVFGQTRLSNSNSCSNSSQVCCPPGHGNNNCCPSNNPVCCPNHLGGACCPGGWGCCPPGDFGELYCCLPGWSCCGSTELAANGCCPPTEPLCCPLEWGGGCCPTTHPICYFLPDGRPACARGKKGLSAEQARATGQFDSVVPQSSKPGSNAGGKKSGGRRRVPSIPRRHKSSRTAR